MSTVVLYTRSFQLRNMVIEAASPSEVDFRDDAFPPSKADLVVTRGQLNTKLERFAWQLGCYVCVLPEGGDHIERKVAQGDIGVIVGADHMKVRL